MSIKQAWNGLWRQPSLAELQATQLDDMERELLTVQRHKEYYQAMELALVAGIERLKGD